MLAFAAGIFHECEYGRTSKCGHESELDVSLLQYLVLELGPHLYERGHVDLVEGRERGRGVLQLLRHSGLRRRIRLIFARVGSLLPAAAGDYEVSGFDSSGLDGGGAGFVSIFGGGGVSFRLSGGGGRCLWIFNHVVASFLQILGSVLVLGPSGSICRS